MQRRSVNDGPSPVREPDIKPLGLVINLLRRGLRLRRDQGRLGPPAPGTSKAYWICYCDSVRRR